MSMPERRALTSDGERVACNTGCNHPGGPAWHRRPDLDAPTPAIYVDAPGVPVSRDYGPDYFLDSDDEISDGFGSTWLRHGPDCDMHVVRPGKAQCSCGDTDPPPPPFAPDTLLGTPVAYGVRFANGTVSAVYPGGHTPVSPETDLDLVRRFIRNNDDALHVVPLFDGDTAVAHVLKIAELYDRLDDHAPQHSHNTFSSGERDLGCAACVLQELRLALGDLLA